MSDKDPPNTISASILAIEANIIIAGIEGVVISWILYRTSTHQSILLAPSDFQSPQWPWWLATLYVIVGLLCVVVIGYIVEGLADPFERILKCLAKKTKIYTRSGSWNNAQHWIWKSAQASQEFSRRRLRILVARNTAVSFFILTIGFPFVAPFSFYLTATGIGLTILFAYLSLDAQKGWDSAVRSAERIGRPR